MATESIPVIDFSSYIRYERSRKVEDINNLLAEWKRAFEEIGFVIVTGHDIPELVCENLQDDAVNFFKQKIEEKVALDLKKGYGQGGYVALGQEVVGKTMVYNKHDIEEEKSCKKAELNVAVKKSVPDFVETLEYIKGFDDNDGEFLIPQNPSSFKDSLENYWNHLHQFYHRMLHVSALSLGLEENFFEEYFGDNPYERLRMAYYPPQDKEKPKPGQLRYGPHTDYACLAIVKPDDAAGGLEVLGKNDNWIPVEYVPGSFIVNVGDLLQRWTNDCWRSVVHRVANPPEEKAGIHRLSLVLFVGPNRNAVIDPMEVCCSEDNPKKYKPIGCKEHLDRKLKISNVKS